MVCIHILIDHSNPIVLGNLIFSTDLRYIKDEYAEISGFGRICISICKIIASHVKFFNNSGSHAMIINASKLESDIVFPAGFWLFLILKNYIRIRLGWSLWSVSICIPSRDLGRYHPLFCILWAYGIHIIMLCSNCILCSCYFFSAHEELPLLEVFLLLPRLQSHHFKYLISMSY